VRDHDARPPFHQRSERRLDQRLRFRIEIRGRFVEDQDARIFQNHPGNRDALLFAPAEAIPTLSDDRIIALWQLANDIMNVRRRQARSISACVASVLAYNRLVRTVSWNK